MLKIQVILGTTRPQRFSDKAASYIMQQAAGYPDLDLELVDLRDYPLPFYDEPVSPVFFDSPNYQYASDVARKWTDKVAGADGYVIVTSEYNHGYPAVLKNALDYVLKEWKNKAVGFVSYGNAGGARAVEQLRQVVVELQMFPIRHSLHIPPEIYMAVRNEKVPVPTEPFNPLRTGRIDRVAVFFNELIWTAQALKAAREVEAEKR
jgi:NAD(P)H-dependent FMN reductase